MIDDLVTSLTDRLTTTTTTDMSYMKSNDDSIDWEYTPFNRTAKLKSKSSKSIEKWTERGATRLYEELTHSNANELQDVSLRWFDDVQDVGYSAQGLYFYEIGPTVATAPGVTWHSAFTLDTETAPEFKSDAWKEAAARFNFSDRDEQHGIPSKVMSMYSALEDYTKRNEHTRAVHPKELRSHGPRVSDRAFEIAVDSLATFDGVHGPADGPAWTYTEPESVATDSTGGAMEPGESTV
jgi:hypothetical protein